MRTYRISSFLMPTFVLVMVLNQVDRHNISYAALTMNRSVIRVVVRMCVCAGGEAFPSHAINHVYSLHPAGRGQHRVFACIAVKPQFLSLDR